ncbi:hypothetical protein [Vibrio sp. TRT 17S01]|uniref:hypothetical protein n=1 Tax=Vibrio sp. TRT 17S01 TaxID=3418505 RepID=UPI003CF30F64
MSDSNVIMLKEPVQKIVDGIEQYAGGLFIWLFFKPITLLSVFLSVSFTIAYSSPVIGLVMLGVPVIVVILLFVSWLMVKIYLQFLFSVNAEDRLGTMLMLSVFVLPPLLILSTINTLFFSVMSSGFSFWVFFTVASFSILLIKRHFPVDWALKHISFSVHTMNIVMIILLLEIVYPYPETVIEVSQIEKCSKEKAISTTGMTSHFTLCIVTIEVDGKTQKIYSSDSEQEVKIRHGLLFDHYS